MALEYNIVEINPIGLEQFSNDDTRIVKSFDINTNFNPRTDKVEIHFYNNDNVLIDSILNASSYSSNQNSETAKGGNLSTITLNPITDAQSFGFLNAEANLVYNFSRNLYSSEKLGGRFFVEEISEDRLELRLLTTEVLEKDIISITDTLKEELQSTSYFNEFRLNGLQNEHLIGINIDVQDYRDNKSIIVKLYEPLPSTFGIKSLFTIEQQVADSKAFNITTTFIPEEVKVPFIKGPNFEISNEESSLPTSYLNYQELFSYPTNNTYRQVNSLFAEKGINLSIDYSDFSNFIHFSSAEERLKNFQYKLNLIEEYQVSSSQAAAARAAGSVTFLSGSEQYWKDKIDEIVNNFDHYDRHLYFKSGSTSWPKQEPFTKPYIQATGSATGSFADEYFALENSSASLYDVSNQNLLLNSVPEYLRHDPDSVNYNSFIHMLAQHFDNIWIYGKALSDKYDNDNRLDYGVSKDLVQELLKNFGVKIYNSFRSTDDLFKVFTGQLYDTGSDFTKELISASNTIESIEEYRQDIHKRLYHNLPYLLKTKGTERGLKALIASFGVPTNNNIIGSGSNINGLYVRTIGGELSSGSLNYGPSLEYTSSVGKIKIDNTGSIATGSTLSNLSSIVQRERKYSDDIHSVEVGYSPTYPLNDYIKGELTSNFNIDDLIGDPRTAYSASYELLISESNRLITQSSPHHYGEFVRILKFYDNVLFKMIKDFVPARSNIDTGIIIKPHLLERNKVKQVKGSFEQKQYTGSIDTAFTTGSQGGAYTHRFDKEFEIPLTSSYTSSTITPDGIATYEYHLKERPRFDGELSGSYLKLTEPIGELNDENTWKYGNPATVSYKGALIELISCPVITTGELNNISGSVLGGLSESSSIFIGATASLSFGSNVNRGFAFSSTNQTPTVSDTASFFTSGSTGFQMDLKNLQTGSWYVRAFGQTEDCGIVYGDAENITISCPTVTTNPESGVGSFEFTASGSITAFGSDNVIIERGFIFWSGSSTAIEIGDASQISRSIDTTSATGSYSFTFANGAAHEVSSNATYYYRAYASSSICTAYGNVESLTTTAESPDYQLFFITPDHFESLSALQAEICDDGTYNEALSFSPDTSVRSLAAPEDLEEGDIIQFNSSGYPPVNQSGLTNRWHAVGHHAGGLPVRFVNIESSNTGTAGRVTGMTFATSSVCGT